jgi:acyl-CoA thioesterase-1
MRIIISSILIVCAGALVWYFLSMPKTVAVPTQIIHTPLPESPTAIKIVAFGDSLTAGLGLPLNESYPAQLEQRLRERDYDVTVINSGVSGETTAGNTNRADFIRAQNPDMVILGTGGNDALRFLPVDEAYINIKSTLTTLLSGENPPQVLLLSIQAPSNAGAQYKESFDALYQRLSSEFSIPLVPFVVPEVALNPQLLQTDGIHPIKEGYEVLVNSYILPAVEQSLKTIEI